LIANVDDGNLTYWKCILFDTFLLYLPLCIFMGVSFPVLQMNTELLKQKAVMLEEYFGIHIDDLGNISRLPVILDQYTPDMDRIPEFVLSLGNDVSYKTLHSLPLHLFIEKVSAIVFLIYIYV
jgi:hypothetical protein